MSIGILEIDKDTGLNVYTHDLSNFDGENLGIHITSYNSLVLLDTDNDNVIFEYDSIYTLKIKNYSGNIRFFGCDNFYLVFEIIDCCIHNFDIECDLSMIYFVREEPDNIIINDNTVGGIVFIEVEIIELNFEPNQVNILHFFSCTTHNSCGDIYFDRLEQLAFDECEMYGEIVGTTVDNLILSNGNYIECLYAYTTHVQLDSETIVERAYIGKDSPLNGIYAYIGGEDRPLSDIGYEAFNYLENHLK